MKKILNILAFLTVFLLGFYLGNSFYSNANSKTNKDDNLKTEFEENQNKATENEINSSIMLDFGNGEVKSFSSSLKTNSSVFDLLKKVTDENEIKLEYKDYGGDLGVMVESINEIENDFASNKYWQYWINNEYAKVGASAQLLVNNDFVEWKFIKGQISY